MLSDSTPASKHPSLAAAKAHHRAGEQLCDDCFARAPHGKSAYDSWYCRCDVCAAGARSYRQAVPEVHVHPSIKAAAAHYAAGEEVCDACFARAPHGTMAAYTAWYCRCPLCLDAGQVAYKARKPQILEYQVDYRANHRPYMRARDRRYRTVNQIRVLERQADIRHRYRSRTDEQVRRDRARLRPENVKGCRECRKVLPLEEFYRSRQSPDGLGVHCKTCDRIKNYSLTDTQHRKIIARSGGWCIYCAGPYEHLDHVLAKKHGGTNDPVNLVVSCERCNLSKLDSMLRDWWPRHFREHLNGVMPKTRKVLLELLQEHGVVIDGLH